MHTLTHTQELWDFHEYQTPRFKCSYDRFTDKSVHILLDKRGPARAKVSSMLHRGNSQVIKLVCVMMRSLLSALVSIFTLLINRTNSKRMISTYPVCPFPVRLLDFCC